MGCHASTPSGTASIRCAASTATRVVGSKEAHMVRNGCKAMNAACHAEKNELKHQQGKAPEEKQAKGHEEAHPPAAQETAPAEGDGKAMNDLSKCDQPAPDAHPGENQPSNAPAGEMQADGTQPQQPPAQPDEQQPPTQPDEQQPNAPAATEPEQPAADAPPAEPAGENATSGGP